MMEHDPGIRTPIPVPGRLHWVVTAGGKWDGCLMGVEGFNGGGGRECRDSSVTEPRRRGGQVTAADTGPSRGWEAPADQSPHLLSTRKCFSGILRQLSLSVEVSVMLSWKCSQAIINPQLLFHKLGCWD